MHESLNRSDSTREVRVDVSSTTEGFELSYNIAPTESAFILRLQSEEASSCRYIMELLSFGLLPLWAEPLSAALRDSKVSALKEIHTVQSRHINCRKERLAEPQNGWRKDKQFRRCVVPARGYFEWREVGGKKVPHYVHRKDGDLLFIASIYAFNENFQCYSPRIPTFTIITGPGTGKDGADLSWLHWRKPLLISPGTKEWWDWLAPDKRWLDSLLDTVLNSDEGDAYVLIDTYTVSTKVGNVKMKDNSVIQEIKFAKQPSITLFFKKRDSSDSHQKDFNESTSIKDEDESQLVNEKTSKKFQHKVERR